MDEIQSNKEQKRPQIKERFYGVVQINVMIVNRNTCEREAHLNCESH